MKPHSSLYAAAALILLANALALTHAARNRSGPPTSEITLTDTELACLREKEDSGILLRLAYSNLHQEAFAPAWLDPARIRALGFDTSVDPSDSRAYEHYRRQRARSAFVAFEFNGPAWQAALEATRDYDTPIPAAVRGPNRQQTERLRGSRLIPIDAALDPSTLHTRYSGRQNILILPAVLRISADSHWSATATRPAKPARLSVSILQVPSEIHVPRPLSESFRRLPFTIRDEKSEQPLYRVTLRYGQFHEPQVTAVQIP